MNLTLMSEGGTIKMNFTHTTMNNINGQIVGYRRVSSIDQNLDRQLHGVTLDRCFDEKMSGKDLVRPELKLCLAHLRAGDTLVVHSIDRLSRSTMDFCSIANELNERGISLQVISPPLIISADNNDPYSVCQLQLMVVFAELERSIIHNRQAEGIAVAKSKGVYGGSKPKLSTEQIVDIHSKLTAGISKAKIAREYKISRQTLYSYLSDK